MEKYSGNAAHFKSKTPCAMLYHKRNRKSKHFNRLLYGRLALSHIRSHTQPAGSKVVGIRCELDRG